MFDAQAICCICLMHYSYMKSTKKIQELVTV